MHSQFEPSESHDTVSPLLPHKPEKIAASVPESDTTAQNEANALLERYLEQVCAKPDRVMTDAERDAMRQELRTHLISASAAYEELGTEPTAAMREAIARFGNAAFVGKGLKQAYRPTRLSRLVAAMMGVTGTFIGGNLLVWAVAMLGMYSGGLPILTPVFWFGAFMGLITGIVVWRRKYNLWRSMAWGGVSHELVAGALCLLLIALKDITWTGTQGLIMVSLLTARMILFLTVDGVAIGTIVGTLARCLRRLEKEQNEVEPPPAMS